LVEERVDEEDPCLQEQERYEDEPMSRHPSPIALGRRSHTAFEAFPD
jgi:hypothetical protein